MSTRSRAVIKQALSVDPVKCQLNFSYEPSNELGTADLLREPIWKTSRSHRVDFREANQSMKFRCFDLLPVTQIDFDAGAASSCEEGNTIFTSDQKAALEAASSCEDGKTIFTSDQRAALEAKFRRKKYPTRQEKDKLASKLGIGISIVQNWFINRRRKWKKEQRKGAVGPSGVRPVLPGVSLTQTSCKISVKSTIGIQGFQQSPVQRHDVQQQPLPTAPLLTAVPFASASHHMMQSFQSYTARSTGTQLLQQKPLPMPSLPSVTEPEHLPHQQVYSPFPGSAEIIPQQRVVGSRLVQQTEATSHLTHYRPPAVKPVKPDFYQLPAADPIHLADEFPFSYSVAKELPHIFEYLEDDQVLNRPLTPSFEPATEPEPWWESKAVQSDLYHSGPANLPKEDFIDNASPSNRHAEPRNFNSCCFGSTQVLSPDLSSGLISKGRSFSFPRQN